MEDEAEETNSCSNCKRDIPVINFLVHTIHCARNIRVCPVCKEPVPNSELEEHHDRLHKLKPCLQCGERVCGSDLEDHVRDSCALTVQPCRYCELELPRKKLPAHESYCGARTERCPDCREYVMIKYRQLHLDSNHGFIKLDDDPSPLPVRKEIPKPKTIIQPTTPPLSNGLIHPSTSSSSSTKLTNMQRPNVNTVPPPTFTKITNPVPSENKYLKPVANCNQNVSPNNYQNAQVLRPKNINVRANGCANGSTSQSHSRPQSVGPDLYGATSSNGTRPKRTNDRPQVNTSVAAVNKVFKDRPASTGAIKKRPAPAPPRSPTAARALHSALQRQGEEEAARREQSRRNLAQGLPPVLSAAEKLDKLRKMDALHNREVDDQAWRSRLQGRVWCTPELSDAGHAGNVLGRGEPQGHLEVDRRRNDFSDLQPMSPEQFARRFQQLQVGEGGAGAGAGAGGSAGRGADRFSEIKTSLRELRRGLNEVTAPYNANSYQTNNNDAPSPRRRSPAELRPEAARLPHRLEHRDRSVSPRSSDEGEVRLPCEFCNLLVPSEDLVQHQEVDDFYKDVTIKRSRLTTDKIDRENAERSITKEIKEVDDFYKDVTIKRSRLTTDKIDRENAERSITKEIKTGCRPELTQYRPRSPAPAPPPADPYTDPVIPCEFCTESLPVYLIQQHQESCRGQGNMFPV